MNCAEIEIQICDYVDGTLTPGQRAEVERHLESCPGCAELARDSAAAVAFMARAADVEPPPELITRILFEAPWRRDRAHSKARTWMGDLLSGFLQPKFAMGMAMTILSLSMVARFVLPARQLRPSDLRPAEVWAGIEDPAVRLWARTVKFYENLKVVYQIEATLKEWQQQNADEQPLPASPDEHKLPVKTRGSGPPPGTLPASH